MKRAVMVLLALVGLVGCQGANPDAPLSNEAHEANWKMTHGPAALQERVTCQVCHGATFAGNGSTIPSCFVCHIGNEFVIHPPSLVPEIEWRHPVNHGSAAKADIKACQGCHGRPGGVGSNPGFDLPLGGLESGCESALGCHSNASTKTVSEVTQFSPFNNGHNPRAAHPAYDPDVPGKQDRRHWYGENVVYRAKAGAQATNYQLTHYNAGNMTTACALCHGAHLNGPAEGGVGPACTSCHVLDPIAYPTRCVSCHGPVPGQTASSIMKPVQLAARLGRSDYSGSARYQTFEKELTSRMKRDPSYQPIDDPRGASYFGPTSFQRYTSVGNLTNRSSHLHHDTLACKDRSDKTGCLGCHNDKPNFVRHHDLMSTKGLFCLNCHQLFNRGGGFTLNGIDDCRYCHLENFCQ